MVTGGKTGARETGGQQKDKRNWCGEFCRWYGTSWCYLRLGVGAVTVVA